MSENFYVRVKESLAQIEADGLTKPERILLSKQGPKVAVRALGKSVNALNFCANNYLGLAGDSRVARASANAARDYGAGMASVRFICGTQILHKELEAELADWLGYEDAILFPAAFDANGALFEPLLDEQDAIISDSLNHASIIDGIRLCKARRFRFPNGDLSALEKALQDARAANSRTIVIATDGVFSMDGHIAQLDAISGLAAKYGALLMVDDCHATGFLGLKGQGTAHFRGVAGTVDFLTGTFGKALGGAMGGFICARSEVVALLRQRARPYLFSNALAPAICGAALEAIRIARSDEGDQRRTQLFANSSHFRAAMTDRGFGLVPGEHPIVPVMLGDARFAQNMAARLLEEGILVTGFSFPVVPRGAARIRVQLSAAHTTRDVESAVGAFTKIRAQLGE